MKIRKFSLVVTDEEGKEVNRKELTTRWDPKIGENLDKFHNVNIEDEIADMLSYEIRGCITSDFVRELL